MTEEKFTRRDALKGLSKLIGISIFLPSALIAMNGAYDLDVQKANYKIGKISTEPKYINKRVKGGLFGGAVSFWLMYYGIREENKQENGKYI